MVNFISLGSTWTDAVAAGGTKYFAVDVPMPFNGLHIEAHSLYGNAAVFVNVAGQNGVSAVPAISYPSSSGATYSSMSFRGASVGADAVDIYPTDAAVRAVCVRSLRVASVCTFLVAVSSTSPASFALYAGVDGAKSRAAWVQ